MTAGKPLSLDLRRPAHLAAIACMLAGLAGLFSGLSSHGKAMAVTGPTALAVSDDTLLLVLDGGLHRLTLAGELRDSRDFFRLGLLGPVTAAAADADGWLVADAGVGQVMRCDENSCRPFLRDASGAVAQFNGRIRLAGDGARWWVADGSEPCLVRTFTADGTEQDVAYTACEIVRDLRHADGLLLLAADRQVVSLVVDENLEGGEQRLLKSPQAGDRQRPMVLAVSGDAAWLLVADAMDRDARLLRASIGEAGRWLDVQRIPLPGENELADMVVAGDALVLSETNGIGLWAIDADAGVTAVARPFGDARTRALLEGTRAKEAVLLRDYRIGVGAMVVLFALGLFLAARDAAGGLPSTVAQRVARASPEAVLVRLAAQWMLPCLLFAAMLLMPTLYVAVRLPELLSVLVMMQLPILVPLLLYVGILWVREDRLLRGQPTIGWQGADMLLLDRTGAEMLVVARVKRFGETLMVGAQRIDWRRHGVPLFAEADLDRLFGSEWRAWHEADLTARRAMRRYLALVLALVCLAEIGVLYLHGEPLARSILAG